jgi:predicted Zn-dependent peptidase
MESFWKEHPLGLPVSGTKESVARIKRRAVMRYFRENYTAKNTIVAIAGNIGHAEARRLAERYFAPLAAGDQISTGPPPRAHALRVVRNKPNLEQTHLCIGTPCPPLISRDRYCAHVLCGVLGGGMSSRLFQNIRERRGLVYSIYSGLNLYRDAGSLVVYAGATPGAAPTVVELTLREMKNLREKLIGPDELKRAEESIKGSIMLSLESSSSRMTHLAQQLLYFGRFYTMEEILEGFDRIRAADVRRLANEIFDTSVLTLVALGSGNGKELESVSLRV